MKQKNKKSKLRRSLIGILVFSVLLSAPYIINAYFGDYYRAVLTRMRDPAPHVFVDALSDTMPQAHVTSDGENAYYYDSAAGGLCKLPPTGERVFLTKTKPVNGIAFAEDALYLREAKTLKKLTPEGVVQSEIRLKGKDARERLPNRFLYKNGVLVGLLDQDAYLRTPDSPFRWTFSSESLDRCENVAMTPDANCSWGLLLNEYEENGFLRLSPPSGLTASKELSFPVRKSFDSVTFKTTMRRETERFCFVVLFRDFNSPYDPEECELSKYEGDILLCADARDGSIRLIAETGAGERIVYADENVYVIYRLQTLTYDFYDRNTGDQIGQLKQEKNPFRAFHDYTYETAGRFLFLYEGDVLLERIDTENIRFLAD